jgi:hypothetical protein
MARKTKRSNAKRRKRTRRNPMAGGAKASIALGVLTLLGSGVVALRDLQKKRSRGCGSKYRSLVVTVSGYTFENPYGMVAFGSDYEEWRELARQISDMANDRLGELGAAECQATGGTNCTDPDEASGGTYPRWNALLDLNNRMTASYKALPNSFTTNPVEGIGRSQAVINDALCLLEKSDEGLKAYGQVPPPIVDPGASGAKRQIPIYAWTALGGAALVAGGVVVGQVWQMPKTASTTVVVDRGSSIRKAGETYSAR